jgi:hypothetical protein
MPHKQTNKRKERHQDRPQPGIEPRSAKRSKATSAEDTTKIKNKQKVNFPDRLEPRQTAGKERPREGKHPDRDAQPLSPREAGVNPREVGGMSRQPKQDKSKTENPGYLHTPQKPISRTSSTREPTTVRGSSTSADPGSLSKSPRAQELGKLSARQNSEFSCKKFGSESRLSRPHRGNLREASTEFFERNYLVSDPIRTTAEENPRTKPASAINPINRQPSTINPINRQPRTQPNHELEMWVRRPPKRVAPTTAAPVTARVTIPDHPAPGTAREPVVRYPTKGASKTPTNWETPGANVAESEVANHHPGGIATADSDTLARFPIPGSPSKRTLAANSRNLARIWSANVNDQITLGESISNHPTEGAETKKQKTTTYLETDINSFLPEEVQGPDDSFTPPTWFLKAIREIAQTKVPTPTKPPFMFEATAEAAEHNGKILARAGFDVGKVLKAHQLSTLGYGCEFRPPDQLEPLLGRHRHFPLLRDLLTEGMSYFYKVKLTEKERAEELEAILERGNHKSAKIESSHVSNLLAKDVTHGFSVPIPLDVIRLIVGAAVQPLGMVVQQTLDEAGKPKVKLRLTQDLSFSSTPHPAPPRSINKRVDMSMYPEMVFGWCLQRIVHFIASLRLHRPNVKILISKYDYSDAYRRIAHSASAAPQTIAVHNGLGFLALRLTFGGSPNPPTWCMVSEMVTDLANEICQCEDWDPTELHNPVQPETPSPIYLTDSDSPCSPAQPMAVKVPPVQRGKVDGFIDDLIHVFWDTPSNIERLPHAVPLAMFVTSRPHAGDEVEPLPRRDILSLPKLKAEGSPAESQIVLGWRVNTRDLTIGLPDNKFADWSRDIQRFIIQKKCTFGELESLAGRLCHASYAIPMTRHFLERIDKTASKEGVRKTTTLELPDEIIQDLKLWQTFLVKANQGVSINLVTTRKPTRICWSDSCPFGMGGYSLATGKAWRIRIPSDSFIFGHPGINNLLEFLGMIVSVWLECRSCTADSSSVHACILALGDNTSAIGWLHKSASLGRNRPAHAAHLFASRHLATTVLDADCCLASQHIKGVENVVSDLLSYVGHCRGKPHPIAADDPPDDVLTRRFHSFYPEQIPANFAICPLPVDVISWLSVVLQMAASSLWDARKAATKMGTAPGDDGSDSNRQSDSPVTPSSLAYPSTNKAFSPKLFSKPCAPSSGPPPARLTDCVRNQWSQTLCGKPQASWVRRFGAISNRAPSTTRMRRTCGPSSAPSCKPTPTRTRPPNDNVPLPQNSCGECTVCPGPNNRSPGTPISQSSAKLQSWDSSSPCAPASAPAHPPPAEHKSFPSKESSSEMHPTR